MFDKWLGQSSLYRRLRKGLWINRMEIPLDLTYGFGPWVKVPNTMPLPSDYGVCGANDIIGVEDYRGR